MRVNVQRMAACAVCIACILVSIFGIGAWKLSKMRGALEDVFIYGTDTTLATRHSMDAYLDRCSEYALRLAQESKQYLSDAEIIDEVLSLADKLNASDGIDGRYEVYTQLSRAVETMYSHLQSAGASNETGVTTAYHDYTSAQNLIKNDGYYMEASEYNSTIKAFPANIISKMFGLKPAETFGG